MLKRLLTLRVIQIQSLFHFSWTSLDRSFNFSLETSEVKISIVLICYKDVCCSDKKYHVEFGNSSSLEKRRVNSCKTGDLQRATWYKPVPGVQIVERERKRKRAEEREKNEGRLRFFPLFRSLSFSLALHYLNDPNAILILEPVCVLRFLNWTLREIKTCDLE